MFAQTLWSVTGNMHHNLAQKLWQVLEKLRQLLGTLSPRSPTGALSLDPNGGLPSPRPSACVIFMCPLFWTVSPPNEFRRRPWLHYLHV